MKQLFERIIVWGADKGLHDIEFNALVQIDLLLKGLCKVNEAFIAGNTDKAVSKICDLIIHAVNALALLDWHNELLDTDFDGTVLENFDNKKCVRLLMQCVFNVTYTATAKKTNTEILCDKYTILIDVCFNCIESLGYSPELALEQTVLKIESRRGKWNGVIGKLVKEKGQEDAYTPDYSLAKLK